MSHTQNVTKPTEITPRCNILEDIHNMRGTPGKPVPGVNDQRIPVRVRVPEKPIKASEEPESSTRGVGTEKKDFDKHIEFRS